MEMKGRRLERGEGKKEETKTKQSNFHDFLSNSRQTASPSALLRIPLRSQFELHIH